MQTINDLRAQVKDLEEQNSTLEEQLRTEPVVETVNWPEYVSLAGQYKLKYKPDWLIRVCAGNEAAVYIAPDEASQALCATEKFSPISFTSIEGDQRTLTEAAVSEYGTDVSITTVTVSGVEGTRASYTHKGNEFVAAGVKYIQYEFFTGGRTYIATYSDGETDVDLSTEFEELVKTLKFSIN